MKQALNALSPEIEEYSRTGVVAILVSSRFMVALVLLALISKQARQGLSSKENWIGGLILGGLMLTGFILQMIGLDSVTPSVSAFLTSLYVVFTALFAIKMSNRKPTRILALGVIMATFGAGFIDGPPHIVWGTGELLTVACAIFFALHIIYTDDITKRMDPLAVALTSFFVVTIGAGIIGIIATKEITTYSFSWKEGVLVPILLLGILGSLVCIVALNALQRYLNPTHAAIIYAFEPVWATIYGLVEGLVTASLWLAIGGITLLMGNIIVEMDATKNENHLNEEAGPE
jgi:drug/metabolite transporter (DMT)-like permease